MSYQEKLHQKHLNGIMDKIGIPVKDDYGRKHSFIWRVDALLIYCEKLIDERETRKNTKDT